MRRPAVTRFAPSPTGRLHVGNARTALFNWMLARQTGGSFVLRLDDTDTGRSGEAFAAAIRDDLAWLGLAWEREERQSRRAACHQAARARLAAAGRLYPCYETPAELAARRRRRRAQGLPPVYDRAALALDRSERAALEAEGRRPHWRFQLDDEAVAFEDRVRGRVEIPAGHLSDPVLVREDGRATYMLASVADDIDMGITHVVRGEDHVVNTAVQIALLRALGGELPAYAHHPLTVAADGGALSKRRAAAPAGGARRGEPCPADVAALRRAGIAPLALVSWLAKVGTSEATAPLYDLAEAVAGFAFENVSRNPPRYDGAELARLNRRWLRSAPFAAVAGALPGLDEAFWPLVRGNIERADQALQWWRICRQPLAPPATPEPGPPLPPEDAAFTARAAGLLPAEPWDRSTWRAWTQAVGEATGRRGRALFMPLRRALTGRESGPEMAGLLPWIGGRRARARLAGSASGAPAPP